jgi:hypothetical protein
MMSNNNPFSRDAIESAVEKVEAQDGNSVNVGAELEPGQRAPSLTVEAQGERDGEKVDVTWGAWARTKLTKATTAVGAKIGFRW